MVKESLEKHWRNIGETLGLSLYMRNKKGAETHTRKAAPKEPL